MPEWIVRLLNFNFFVILVYAKMDLRNSVPQDTTALLVHQQLVRLRNISRCHVKRLMLHAKTAHMVIIAML